MIQLKRVYDKPAPRDGVRFLIERLWPRGVRKTDVHEDGWLKDAGPSDRLRKWFFSRSGEMDGVSTQIFRRTRYPAGSLADDSEGCRARYGDIALQLPRQPA
jgi:uncharacterized protein YeaO (DUF488 family)